MPHQLRMTLHSPCEPPEPPQVESAPSARHRSLRARALPHGTGWRLFAAAVLSSLAACAGEASGHGRLDEAEARRQVERLIELCTPLDPTLTSDHHDRQLHEQRAHVQALCRPDETVGRAALAAYEEHTGKENPVLVRVRLLEVGGHAAPELARPLLVDLVQTYGYEMADRTEAVRVLAETSPETALEVLRPMIETRRKTSTMPDDEFLLRGYVTACRGADVSPVPVLAEVVTNFHKQDTARHYAAEALGDHEDPLAVAALKSALVESGGNGYLRRKAAQSLRKVLPAEEACALFREVADREAETSFLQFMINMLEDLCP